MSEDSSSSDEDRKTKHKNQFIDKTGVDKLCLTGYNLANLLT